MWPTRNGAFDVWYWAFYLSLICTAWTSIKYVCENQMGSPRVSLASHPTSGKQEVSLLSLQEGLRQGGSHLAPVIGLGQRRGIRPAVQITLCSNVTHHAP